MNLAQPHTAERERSTPVTLDRPLNGTAAHSPGQLAELHFELALWTRGLENFCSIGQQAFPNERNPDASRNFKNELHVVHAVLIRCGELIEELNRQIAFAGLTIAPEVKELQDLLRPMVSSNAALVRSNSLNFAEWNAWSEIVADRIARSEIYDSFDSEFEEAGLAYLPEALAKLLMSPDLGEIDRTDLRICLPRLGGILRSLEVVRRMHASDAPLKPTLAIFAFVYEAVNELIFDLNERLLRRRDETSEIFALLDAATYTLAIESKKVYTFELSSVIGTRSASLVFARIESAFALLNDNIRHLLTGFLRVSDPDVEAISVFPEFSEKLEQSIAVRSSLWAVLNTVRAAEADISDSELRKLRSELEIFLEQHLGYLFYKDRDTFERFCEEILISSGGPDVRPLLHRFSAYVETLFNQVGMRVVLANHPFTPYQSDH